MDKARKKNIKRIIALVCVACVVVLLAAMPLIAKQDPEDDGPKASILSNTVSAGSINTELIGGGTLAEEDAVTISVPAAVKLTEYLVSNGQTVTEGTPIASVDRVAVMTAISQVQETLEYLSEEIEDASDVSTTEKVNALAGGTVKILYAKEGDSVQSVMLEHGALAVLSLDGLMAVDLGTESTLAAGTAVTVTLSDGTVVSGKIVKNLAGEMTVTVEDDGYTVSDAVQITAEDGTAIGSGELYIYSPWNAAAYAGTVDSIKVSVGDKLSAGKTLMSLSDVGYSAAYRQLIGQRQEYEDMMLELFQMYQTETITAPCDGVVSGIDENSVQLLSDNGQGFVLSFLSNAPAGDPDAGYTNFVGQITDISDGVWSLNINPSPFPVDDYLNLPSDLLNTSSMTQPVTLTPEGLQVYTRSDEDWVITDVSVGDILLFAADSNGGFVWSVKIGNASLPDMPDDPTEPSDPTQPRDPTEPSDPTVPSDPTEPSDPTNPSNPTEPSDPTQPSSPTEPGNPTEPNNPTDPGTPTRPSGSGNPGFTYPSGGNWSGMGGGMVEQESTFELYGLEMAEIAAVIPQSTMILNITIDELDIRALQVGMTAQVKIDALGGEKYMATITEIGNTGTNNGGNSKYTVELTMDRADNMLSGMNATATIVLATVNDVLTIPADALVEQGNQTIVYTGYDEETETLLNPVTVKIGCSDGEIVEILDGLANGQTYYYAYYDTLEISFTPDFGGGGFMFG